MRPAMLKLLLVLALNAAFWPALVTSAAVPTPQTPAPTGGLNQADLEELMGPIALYPDELLANVLAASVYPQELLAAQAYLDKGGDASKVNEQAWESPVKSIANIPDVLKFLTDNMEWTEAVGQAYIIQSSDVMKAVQALRAKAKDNGVLQSNEQQTIVTEGSTIIIEPADPQIIYVPQYNPQTVYVEHHDDDDELLAGLIGFGVGVAVGACFNDNFYCGWGGGYVGWGWGGGYHGDIDIDRNFEINGDVNIGSGNTINRGDRTNIKGGDRNTANVGREGSRWEPNSSKVDTNKIKQGGAKQLEGFKGASTNRGATTSNRMPKSSVGNSGRQSPATVTKDNRPKPSQGGVKQRTPSAGAAPSARPATPGTGGAARPSTGSVPKPKTTAPRAPSSAASRAPAQSKPSGFSPDRGSSSASQRGSSSRSSASSRSSGGSRSGGGSRGGGGRGGGGRRG